MIRNKLYYIFILTSANIFTFRELNKYIVNYFDNFIALVTMFVDRMHNNNAGCRSLEASRLQPLRLTSAVFFMV